MSWDGIPDDTVLLIVTCGDAVARERVNLVRATMFANLATATSYHEQNKTALQERVLLHADPLPAASWTGRQLRLTKADLARYLPDHPVFLVEVVFGAGAKDAPMGRHALIEWKEEGGEIGFFAQLESNGVSTWETTLAVDVDPTDAIPPVLVHQCEIVLEDEPSGFERVILAGTDNPYHEQARYLMLIQEFGHDLEWRDNHHTYELLEDERVGDHTDYWDDLLLTLITARPGDERRISFVRMFPPGEHGAIGSDNQPTPRDWVHWYAVAKHGASSDPCTGGTHGAERAYAYLKWIAAHDKYRVEGMVFVSHAWVGGPTHLTGGSGRVSDFDSGGIGTGILDAFADNALYWVTGCNVFAAFHPDQHPLSRQALAKVESLVRARIRLRSGMVDVRDALASSDLATAQSRIREVLGDGAEPQPWQRPGTDEGCLLQAIGRRTAGEIHGLRGGSGESVGTRIDRIVAWSDEASPDDLPEADVRAILDILEWSSFAEELVLTHSDTDWREADPATESIPSGTTFYRDRGWQEVSAGDYDRQQHVRVAQTYVEDPRDVEHDGVLVRGFQVAAERRATLQTWLELTRRFMSASHHYMAAFAKMAAPTRGDIRAWGGNPGQDAQHMDVEITLEPGSPVATFQADESLSAYFRNDEWSGWNRPWFLAYYHRWGQEETDVLGYFAYQGKLDVDGNYAATFDTETLFTPPSRSRLIA